MSIVDNVMSGLRDKSVRETLQTTNASRQETGPEALALGKPSDYTVDDRIGGTHTRTVHDPIIHENVIQHAHHEVTPIVNRVREETEIHQKIQPVTHTQEHHTHHQHVAPHVARHVQEDITEEHANKFKTQGLQEHKQTVGDQSHSTSVNAPIVREHVNRHIIEEIHPIIQRQLQRVEHHHTTQQINETHVKAPIIHDMITNVAITYEEFAGKLEGLAKGSVGSTTAGMTTDAAGGLGGRAAGHGHTGNTGTGLVNAAKNVDTSGTTSGTTARV